MASESRNVYNGGLDENSGLSRTYQVVVAATRDMGIGEDGKLPWKLPSDLKYFRDLTLQTSSVEKRNAVVMGRKTWESIPSKYCPLPGRLNVVLTRSRSLELGGLENVLACESVESALELLGEQPYNDLVEKVFVIGGGQILRETLNAPACDAIHVTEIETSIECDTFIPSVDTSLFRPWYSSLPLNENNTRFSFVTYVRVRKGAGENGALINGSKSSSGKFEVQDFSFLPRIIHEKHGEFMYLRLVQEIISSGNLKNDRTGTGTLSKFGCQMRFNLRKSFPLLTTNKVFWRGVIEELLWFISGSTNAKKTIIEQAGSVIKESTREVYNTLRPDCIMMADMGCSSGPNALLVVSKIIDVIDEACRSKNHHCPQIGVFLNDLPGNDFNTLFSLLPSFDQAVEEAKGSNIRPCFVSGIPKSFYGRVFPDKFLHFVHSTYSVHWLSQVPRGLVSENGEPLNKGNIYISKTSPREISKEYYAQFKRDFTLFLRSRSREMVSGGQMVLIFVGSNNSEDPDSIWELLGSTLNDLVSTGVIEKEKLDRFNMPIYSPTVEEVRKLVQAEGSFVLNNLETFTVDWSIDTSQNLETRAKFVVKAIRAVAESLLATVFSHAAMDDLFLWFETRVKERIVGKSSKYLNIVLSITNK